MSFELPPLGEMGIVLPFLFSFIYFWSLFISYVVFEDILNAIPGVGGRGLFLLGVLRESCTGR